MFVGWPQPDKVHVAIQATGGERGEILDIHHNDLQIEFIDSTAYHSLVMSSSQIDPAKEQQLRGSQQFGGLPQRTGSCSSSQSAFDYERGPGHAVSCSHIWHSGW